MPRWAKRYGGEGEGGVNALARMMLVGEGSGRSRGGPRARVCEGARVPGLGWQDDGAAGWTNVGEGR